MNAYIQQLERIAADYHLNDEVPDKFIEDMCQEYTCTWLGSLLRPNDRVIELGVGEGITLSRLAPLAYNYTVVEGAPSLAAQARATHPQVEVVQALFEEYMPAVACDRLLALHVLEHVDAPVELARHLRGWLKPDGELIVIVPNRASLHRRLAMLMGLQPALDTLSARDHLVGHQRVYDIADLHRDLQDAGFDVLETRGFFLKTLPNSMMLGHPPTLIQALNQLSEELPAEYQANLAVRARPAG